MMPRLRCGGKGDADAAAPRRLLASSACCAWMSRSDGDAGAPPASHNRGSAEAPEADETRGSSAERGTRTAPLGDVPAEDTGTARGCGVTAGAREAAAVKSRPRPGAKAAERC